MLKMCLYVCLVKLRGNVTSKSWVVAKCFINTAASFKKNRLLAFFFTCFYDIMKNNNKHFIRFK